VSTVCYYNYLFLFWIYAPTFSFYRMIAISHQKRWPHAKCLRCIWHLSYSFYPFFCTRQRVLSHYIPIQTRKNWIFGVHLHLVP
jgi:hypothetical protein